LNFEKFLQTERNTMTTTNTPETPSNTQHPARGCGPRGCGPRGAGPRFGGPFGPHFAARFGGSGGPFSQRNVPVNIEESADAFIVSLYAAGLDKNAFHVSAQADVLSIRYAAAAPDESSARKFTRREQADNSFAREFALNARVQVEAISATYSDGVLTVRLPKTPDAMQPEHQVPVQ
jgi:HSP20 family protein